ncbi:MAG: PEP-CTERM system TPR-repeat protein PrsT [Gammaproteobacteria bacterium]|jgi:putative PEP-CTERM system TPR-repeat lipoprotein
MRYSQTSTMTNPGFLLLWLIALLCLTGSMVALAADSDDYLGDARAYFDKGEVNAAVIQLKNALLADPENKEARLLLGKIYLEKKDGLSAEKELRHAQELGVARQEVLVPLGRALLMTGQNNKVLQTITPEAGDSETLRADIQILQGQAYLATGKNAMAEEQFSRALELKPSAADALLGKARIAYQNQDTTGATAFIEQALASEPDNSDAWTLKGELLRQTGQQQEALAAFQKAVAAEPDNAAARVGLATVLLALGKTDQADAEIDGLLKTYPGLYLANYLKALVRYQQQQPGPAQESVQLALKQAPGHLPSHLLAGTIAYQQGDLNQAEQQLRIYLGGVPGNTQASKLLAATLLKLKQADKAIAVLEPGVSAASQDAQYLSLLGSAYLSQGNTARGMEYLEQAAAIAPDVAGIRAQLAIGELAQGDVEQGISELQSAVDLGQGLVQADVLLVIVYLKQKDFDQALAAADALAKKMSDSPVPLNLKGAALLGKEDRQGARQAFEAALQLQPEFVPAHLNLAQLELMEGNTAAAEGRYRKALSYDAGNLKALLSLAALSSRDGQVEKTAQWLKQAYEQHPEAIQPGLLLVQHYLQQGETTRALDLAGAVAVAHPRDPSVLRVLAQVQLKAGKGKDALDTLRTLVEVEPDSPEVRYLLAMVQVQQKDTAAARSSLERAIQLQPDYPAAQLLLGRLDIADKDYPAALAIATELQKAHPEAAYGDELKGDVYAAREEFRQAADTYALAYGKAGSALLAKKLFQSRLKLGDSGAANEALRQWLAEHPEDVAVRGLLAQSLLSSSQQAEAIAEYRKLLEYEPDNVTTLNNLAWLYQEANDPEGVTYAERAYKLAADRPEVIDTLGWLLVQNGDTNRGLVLLQEAAMKAPHIPDIRFHMAAALEKAGRRDEARKELGRLLKSSKTFPERDKAEALHKQLGG